MRTCTICKETLQDDPVLWAIKSKLINTGRCRKCHNLISKKVHLMSKSIQDKPHVMRTCTKCGDEFKDLKQNWRRRSIYKNTGVCNLCNLDFCREYYKKHSAYYINKNKAYRQKKVLNDKRST